MWFLAPTRFDENRTLNLPFIEFSKTSNVLSTNIQCPLVEASVNVDVGAEVEAQVSLSVVVSGSVIPPKLDEFGVITGNLHPLSRIVVGLIGIIGIDANLLRSLGVVADALVSSLTHCSHTPRLNALHRASFGPLPLICSE